MKPQRKFTPEIEKQIRKRFFFDKATPLELMTEFGVSIPTLTRILGQSPGRRGFKPESMYS